MMLDLNLILKCFLHTSMLLFIAKLYFFRYGHNLRMFSGLQEIEHLYFNARPMETLSLKSIRKVLPFTSSETKKKKSSHLFGSFCQRIQIYNHSDNFL